MVGHLEKTCLQVEYSGEDKKHVICVTCGKSGHFRCKTIKPSEVKVSFECDEFSSGDDFDSQSEVSITIQSAPRKGQKKSKKSKKRRDSDSDESRVNCHNCG